MAYPIVDSLLHLCCDPFNPVVPETEIAMVPRLFVALAFCVFTSLSVADFAYAVGPSVPVEVMKLYARAEVAFDEGRLTDAESLYEQALAKYPSGLGLRVSLGLCREQMGHLPEAWETMRETVDLAKSQENEARLLHDSRGRAHAQDMRKQAEEAMARITPNVGWVKLEIAPAVSKLENRQVSRDDVVLPLERAEPFPVTKGRHEFTARAGKDRLWSKTVDIQPNEHTPMHPLILLIEDSRLPTDSSRGRRVAGYALGGVGIGSLVTAAVLLAIGSENAHALFTDGLCTAKLDRCDEDPETKKRYADAAREKAIGGTLLGAGAVFVGVGLTLVLKSSRAPDAPSVGMFVGPNGMGVRGTF